MHDVSKLHNKTSIDSSSIGKKCLLGIIQFISNIMDCKSNGTYLKIYKLSDNLYWSFLSRKASLNIKTLLENLVGDLIVRIMSLPDLINPCAILLVKLPAPIKPIFTSMALKSIERPLDEVMAVFKIN